MPITTPLMNLVIPDVGVTPGTFWASLLNEAFQRIDAHNHTAGDGATLGPASLTIDGDLDMNGFNITNARSYRSEVQAAPLALPQDINSVYSVNGDLYWNNGTGFPVKITDGINLNAASLLGFTGDYGPPTLSEANYDDGTKTYRFWQNAGVTANVEARDLIATNDLTVANDATITNDLTIVGDIASVTNITATNDVTITGNIASVTDITMTGELNGFQLLNIGPVSFLRAESGDQLQIQTLNAAVPGVFTAKAGNVTVDGPGVNSTFGGSNASGIDRAGGTTFLQCGTSTGTGLGTVTLRGTTSQLTGAGVNAQTDLARFSLDRGHEAFTDIVPTLPTLQVGTVADPWEQVTALHGNFTGTAGALLTPTTGADLYRRTSWNNMIAFGEINVAGGLASIGLNILATARIGVGLYQATMDVAMTIGRVMVIASSRIGGTSTSASHINPTTLEFQVSTTAAGASFDAPVYFLVVGRPT